MFPSASSLVTQCLVHLETRFLKIDSDDHCGDLVLKLTGGEGCDEWYKVKVVWTGGMEWGGLFCITEWTLAVTSNGLVLRVIRARHVSVEDWKDTVLTPIEHNPRIKETLHKIRYQAMTTLANRWEIGQEQNTECDCLNSYEDETEMKEKGSLKRVLPFGNCQMKTKKRLNRTHQKREMTQELTGCFSPDSLLFLKYVYKI